MANFINIPSDVVEVFPALNRSVQTNNSRSFTEYNITRIVNQMSDTDSFIISTEIGNDIPFEFNMGGYNFKITSYREITDLFTATAGTYIYAEIKVDTACFELAGYDEETFYTGLNLDTVTTLNNFSYKSKDADYFYFRLPLFVCNSANTWEIEPSSCVRFNSNSIKVVDGGED